MKTEWLCFCECYLIFIVLRFGITDATSNQTSGKNLIKKSYTSDSTSIFVTNDGPTLIGTKTNFNVTINTPQKGTILLAYFKYNPYKFVEETTNKRFYRFSIKEWHSTGVKLVYVTVKQKDSFGRLIVLGTNYTSLTVSDKVYCKIMIWQHGSLIQNNSVNLGNVTFEAQPHDPNKIFKSAKVTTVWYFSDQSSMVSSDTAITSHFFLKEGKFSVHVLAFIKKGKKKYIGNGDVIVNAVSRVRYELVVWQRSESSGPRVPSAHQCVSPGNTLFFVRSVDPYHILNSAHLTYYWEFDGSQANKSTSNSTMHRFTTPGHKTVSVDIVAVIKDTVLRSSVEKVIRVEEPIHSIVINGKRNTDQGELVKFNVTCKGSPPVSFCWYISEGGCQLPQNVMCSPTVIYKSCWNIFYHKFRYSGNFCVNVSVINTVSVSYDKLQVNVKGIHEVDKSHIVAIASTLPFAVVFILIIAVVIAIKHSRVLYYRKNKRSETAEFDFRRSNASYEQWSYSGRCSRLVVCPERPGCSWPCLRVGVDDIDDSEEQLMFSDPSSPATPQRKTSYYGTIHINLLQDKHSGERRKEDDTISEENIKHSSF